MNGLNISKLKKVSSDKNTTTFKHPDGHEIKVAHHALSAKMRKDLEKIPHYAEGTPDEPIQPNPQPTYDPSDTAQPTQAEAPAAAPDQQAQAANQAPLDIQPVSADEASPQTQQAAPAPVADAPPPKLNPAQKREAIRKEILDEHQKVEQDVASGQIKPETYQSLFAKGTLGKIRTAFGMLLSGMGSGLSHQPNALLHMMDQTIGNDLDAQTKNVGNAQNLLKLNQQNLMNQAQVKNLDAETKAKAYATTRMQMNSMALHDVVKMVQGLPEGSPSRQKAEQAMALMYPAVQAENYNIADKYAVAKAMMGGSGAAGGDEQQFQNRQAALNAAGPTGQTIGKFEGERHFPGIEGQASRPLDKNDQSEIEGHLKLQAGLNDLLDFAKTHSTIIPGTKEYNIGQAKARKVQAEVREGVLNTVYREGEQPLLDKFVSQNPAGIDKWWKSIPQLSTVLDSSKRDLNVKKKTLGFPVQEEKQNSSSGLQEGKTGTYQGKPTIVRNGKWEYR